MNLQRDLKLYLRDIIDNWRYIDIILFMAILVIYSGFTDPCDRCNVNLGQGEMTCKEAFMNKIGYEINEDGIMIKKNPDSDYLNLQIINFSIPET